MTEPRDAPVRTTHEGAIRLWSDGTEVALSATDPYGDPLEVTSDEVRMLAWHLLELASIVSAGEPAPHIRDSGAVPSILRMCNNSIEARIVEDGIHLTVARNTGCAMMLSGERARELAIGLLALLGRITE